MIDLTPFLGFLTSLGPWGYVAAAALPLLLSFLKNRITPPAAPTLPTPPASPANNPPALAPSFPLLNMLLQGLGVISKGSTTATTADVSHPLLSRLTAEVQGVTAHHVAAHQAALTALGVSSSVAASSASSPAIPKS